MDVHVTIDFFDDLFFGRADWDESLLRQLIAGYARRGVTQIHWIDYGTATQGAWDTGSYFDPHGRGARFATAVPDALAVVVDEAHRHGVRVVTVLKIDDLALGAPFASFPHGQGPVPAVGLPHVGGTGSWALRWLRENPQYRFQLHPSLRTADSGAPIRSIRLWHESHLVPEGLGDIRDCFELWVSQDNGRYRPYARDATVLGSVQRRRAPVFSPAPRTDSLQEAPYYCVEWSNLNITERFVCIFPRRPVAIANDLSALVECHDSLDNPVSLTFGFTAHQPYGASGHDWRQVGISFDTSRRTTLPGRGDKPFSAGRARLSLTDRLGRSPNGQTAFGRPDQPVDGLVVGLARGRNEYLTQPLDLAHEQARLWLTDMAAQGLDAGADAIDLRFGGHTESLDWENYGYSEPAMESFRRLHGVDPATQPFDIEAWHELRGGYSDRFIGQVAAMARARGRPCIAHVESFMDGNSQWPKGVRVHNQRWNWRNWIRDGLLDGITLKGARPGTSMFDETLRICRHAGLPVTLNTKVGGADRESAWIELMDHAKRAGIEHFNLYESANLARLEQDGQLVFGLPRLWQAAQKGRWI